MQVFTRRTLLISAGLGLTWYAVLLIPAWTRAELLGENGRSPLRLCVLMLVASMLASWISSKVRPGSRVWRLFIRGIGIALVGTVGFVVMTFATDMFIILPGTLESPHPDGWLVSLLKALFAIYLMAIVGIPGIVYVVFINAFYVIVPMGFIHAAVLSSVIESNADQQSHRFRTGSSL